MLGLFLIPLFGICGGILPSNGFRDMGTSVVLDLKPLSSFFIPLIFTRGFGRCRHIPGHSTPRYETYIYLTLFDLETSLGALQMS